METAGKEAQSAKPGQWIWVRLPNRVFKDDKPVDIKVAMTDLKMFTKEELDKISRDHPIFIQAGIAACLTAERWKRSKIITVRWMKRSAQTASSGARVFGDRCRPTSFS